MRFIASLVIQFLPMMTKTCSDTENVDEDDGHELTVAPGDSEKIWARY